MLEPARLSEINATLSGCLGGWMFEKDVSLNSPVVSRANGNFLGAYSYMNGGGYYGKTFLSGDIVRLAGASPLVQRIIR